MVDTVGAEAPATSNTLVNDVPRVLGYYANLINGVVTGSSGDSTNSGLRTPGTQSRHRQATPKNKWLTEQNPPNKNSNKTRLETADFAPCRYLVN